MGNTNESKGLPRRSPALVYAYLVLLGTFLTLLVLSVAGDYSSFLGLNSLSQSQHAQSLESLSAQQSSQQELYIDTLTLLKDLLNRIDNEENSGPSSELSTAIGQLSKRDLISAFSGLFGGISDSFSKGVDGASMYLGVGIGNGTLKGLEVGAPLLKANTVVTPPTGLNAAALELGSGAASEIVGSLDLKTLLQTTPASRNELSKAFAQGLGSGGAAALNLKPLDTNAFNSTGFNGIGGNFGQGLSTSFLGGVDLQKVFDATSLTNAQMNEAALSLAQGLGSGSAYALKLTTTPPDNTSFNTDGINGLAGNMGQGLSSTFLSGVDLKAMFSGASSAITGPMMLKAAQGLGSGLGEGSAIGLGFQKDAQVATTTALNATSNSMPDVGVLVENFAKGLSERFLANGTLQNIMTAVTGNSTGLSINMVKAAEGLGIGLVDGAQLSLMNAGGLQKILGLNSSEMVTMMTLPNSTTFDDSLGGAAVGFGSGLSFEFTKGLLQALGKPSLVDNSTIVVPDNTTITPSAKVSSSVAPLNTGPLPNIPTVTRNKRALQAKRQDLSLSSSSSAPTAAPTSAISILNNFLTPTNLNPILQAGSDALGCQGIGGLAAIFESLSKSKVLGNGSAGNLTSSFGALTNHTYTTHDANGNTFTINIADLLLTTNGNSLSKEFKLIISHIGAAAVAFVIAIPILIILNCVRNLAIMTGRTQFLQHTPRIQLVVGIMIVVPAMAATLVLGFLAEGKRNHFYSFHGILGLALLILTLVFPVLHIIHRRQPTNKTLSLIHKSTLGLLVQITLITITTGFVDLSTISSCLFQFLPQVLFVSAGFAMASPIFAAMTMLGVELGLKRWGSPDGILMLRGSGSRQRSGSLEKGVIGKPKMEVRVTEIGAFVR